MKKLISLEGRRSAGSQDAQRGDGSGNSIRQLAEAGAGAGAAAAAAAAAAAELETLKRCTPKSRSSKSKIPYLSSTISRFRTENKM
jgi:hypothetical protein